LNWSKGIIWSSQCTVHNQLQTPKLFYYQIFTELGQIESWIPNQTQLTDLKQKIGTWIVLCCLWEARQTEQRAPLLQSKQYILHSLLCESEWTLHWTKKLVWRSGCNHGGHLISSSFRLLTPTTPSPSP